MGGTSISKVSTSVLKVTIRGLFEDLSFRNCSTYLVTSSHWVISQVLYKCPTKGSLCKGGNFKSCNLISFEDELPASAPEDPHE